MRMRKPFKSKSNTHTHTQKHCNHFIDLFQVSFSLVFIILWVCVRESGKSTQNKYVHFGVERNISLDCNQLECKKKKKSDFVEKQ